MNQRPNKNQYFSTSVEKGLRVLNLFNHERQRLSLKEITESIGISKVSAFRYVNTLIELGYLRKEPQTKLIKLGPAALTLSNNLMRSFDLLEIIKPFIDDVYHTYNVSIDSALLEGDTLLKLYQRVVTETLMYTLPMVETGLHCTALGKAILSHLPEKKMLAIVDRLNLVKKTKYTLINKADLIADLEKSRERGYSINNEEYVQGLIALGAPIINKEKKQAIGAISFNFSTIEYSMDIMERKFAKAVVDLAKDISEMLPVG